LGVKTIQTLSEMPVDVLNQLVGKCKSSAKSGHLILEI